MTEIKSVHSPEQIQEVVDLAHRIWTEHYVPIIGQAQVDYMLETFQSAEAISAQLADGYEYYLAVSEGKNVGYLAVVPDTDRGLLMISKIYVTKTERGHGFGRDMLRFAEDLCRTRKFKTLWLTVNKHNTTSIAWYTRTGFTNAGSVIQEIGAGFVMDDYRMEKEAWE